MIKRVNSTGRKRIPRERVAIEVYDGSPRTFDATLDLSDFDATPDAAVVLEATCAGSNTISRFEWGTLGTLISPPDRELRDLHGENVFFSLKVIDRSERFGRILGLAENIRPLKGGSKTATGRRGILPVQPAKLDDEVWKLEFRTEGVFLLVNEGIAGLADRFRFDPSVYTLIYPSVVREVLSRALRESVDSDDTESWPVLWLRFAQRLHPERESPPRDEDEEPQAEWIDEVVGAFCREHKLRDVFCQALFGRQDWEDSP